MVHKRTSPRPHAEFRHRSQSPMPAVAEVEQRWLDGLNPSWLAPRQLERRAPRQPPRLLRMRQRLLPVPVIVALMVSVGWRRGPAIAEGQQVLARAGLVGGAPLRVRPPAIPTRLAGLPAAVLGQRCAEVCRRLQAPRPPPLPPPSWAPVREACPCLALVDGSPLAALRTKPQGLRPQEGRVVAGTSRVMVAACSPRPLWHLSPAEAWANATRFAAASRTALPGGGRWLVDLGLCSVLWCDACTTAQRFCVTRMREKSASRPVQGLSQGADDRAESIQVGLSRSHPGQPPLRLVSVLWHGAWSRSLTHGLAPQTLPAPQGCAR